MPKDPHTRSFTRALALYGLGLGLSLVAVGVMALLLRAVLRSNPSRMAVEEPAPPPKAPNGLEPSPQVVAFAAYLKGIPSLAELEPAVIITCKGVGKPRSRPHKCTYHAGSIEVTVGYDRDDGTLRSASFKKRDLDDTPPLPWSDFAGVMPWVCHEISTAAALATMALAADSYPTEPWASAEGMTMVRPGELGRRELHFALLPPCDVVLTEQVDRGRNYSVLSIVRPKTPRIRVPRFRRPDD